MAGWTPWTDEPSESIRLEIAGNMLELRRLQLGDAKTLERREQKFGDLVLHQENRPRMRQLELRFGAFKKDADLPQSWAYPRFITLMRLFPGWPVTLIWPDETIMHGIILDHYNDESSDCQAEINFTFSIMREYPQGRVLAL